MKRSYSQLDLDERRKIEHWCQADVPVEVIAEKLGRHRSTIFRERALAKMRTIRTHDQSNRSSSPEASR